MFWCSTATGRRPVSSIITSFLGGRYVICAAYYSVDVASWSCHAGPHVHAGVNVKQFYENAAALLKPLSHVISVQRANCHEDVAAALEH